MVFRKKENERQGIHKFSLRMFKMWFLRFLKLLETTWNSREKPVELTQKQETTTTTSQSWYSYVVMLLKLTVQKQLALYPCDPFFINNLNMTVNSLEKKLFSCVKLLVKLRFKLFYWHHQHRLFFPECFGYPSSKRVIYWPKLKL